MQLTTPPQYYGHQFFIRKTLGAFLNFFTDRIYVERYDEHGNVAKYIQVPIDFANKDKVIRYVQNSTKENLSTMEPNPTGNHLDVGKILPRIAVSLLSLQRFPDLQRNKFKTVKGYDVDGKIVEIPTPVTYQLNVSMGIIAKTYDDLHQIIEQIIPYFRPSVTLNVNLLEGFPPDQVTVEMADIQFETREDLSITDIRIIQANVFFTITTKIYYIKRNQTIIRRILANFRDRGDPTAYLNYQTFEITGLDQLRPVTDVIHTSTAITDYRTNG